MDGYQPDGGKFGNAQGKQAILQPVFQRAVATFGSRPAHLVLKNIPHLRGFEALDVVVLLEIVVQL